MPDPATEQTTETTAPAATEQAPKAPDPEVTALKEKYDALEKFAKGAVMRADNAESYVQQMTASLQQAAERVTQVETQSNQPDIRERFAEDPVSVLDQHFQARTAPIVGAVAESHAHMRREVAMMKFNQEKIPGTDKSLGEVYAEELDEFMKPMPSTSRAQPGAWEAGMQWVRSRHVDDEVQMRMQAQVEREKRAFTESPTAGPGKGPLPKTLTDLEKTVAKGLGLDDSEYIKYRDME